MNPEFHQEQSECNLEEQYINPEELDNDTIEKLLQEGQVTNIKTIEEVGQKVPPHRDKVLVGDLSGHRDEVFEAEIVLPNANKKMLVVYKPQKGINCGPDTREMVPIPKESSPYHAKEVAAWKIAKALELEKIATPVVTRELNEGIGSLRPYLWGEPLDILPEETEEKAFSNNETLEDFALYDFVIQNLDRRNVNLIWIEDKNSSQLKAIDHTLTFFDDEFASQYTIKGPRLMIAFDNSVDPPRLKKTSLPERLITKIDDLLSQEEEIRQDLSALLNKEEIDGVFERVKKLKEQNIFL